jgi:hypothetical protein
MSIILYTLDCLKEENLNFGSELDEQKPLIQNLSKRFDKRKDDIKIIDGKFS